MTDALRRLRALRGSWMVAGACQDPERAERAFLDQLLTRKDYFRDVLRARAQRGAPTSQLKLVHVRV